MKNRRFIIHVGLQKTASTFLQEVLFPRFNNIVYIGRPYTQENFAFNCLQYADNSLYDVSEMRREINRIEKANSEGNPILISDELFSGLPSYNFINRGTIAERLSKAIPDAEIVLFFRGQVDLVMSLYNQYVKIGWVDGHLNESFLYRPGKGFPLEKWFEGERSWTFKNRFIRHRSLFTPEHFRYSKLYSLYSDLFKKVHIFLYEDLKNDQKTFFIQLASVLSADLPSSLEIDEKLQKTAVNISLDKKQLQVRRIQNKISHVLPMVKTRWCKILLSSISPFLSDREDSYRAYVTSLLRECDIFGDNYSLNQKANLGMERFPKQYFGNSS